MIEGRRGAAAMPVEEPAAAAPAASPAALPVALDAGAARARFAHVRTWVFDLDNTLYPPDSDLWPQIDQRITHYLAHLLDLDGLSARGLQKHYYRRYGTTLHGLISEHGTDPAGFLDFVHDIDRSRLPANAPLGLAIAALPGRKLILTSGSRDHALKTVAQLGLGSHFEDVFDIVAANLVPKPSSATYERFFALHDVDPGSSAMFEDIARNLEVPRARGMVTTLIVPRSSAGDHREPWERTGVTEDYVEFVTDDLPAFLRGLVRA